MGIAPSCGLNRDDGKRKSGSESATEKQQRSFQLSAVVGGKGLWVAAWKKAADFCRYSYLRATIGSTRIARRAGIYVARKATTTNPSDAMPNVAASVGRAPYSNLEISRVERGGNARPQERTRVITFYHLPATRIRTSP